MLVNIHSAILIYYIQGKQEGVCACRGWGHAEKEGRVLYEPCHWSQVLINKTSASVGGSKLEKKVELLRRQGEKKNLEEFVVHEKTRMA